MWRQGFLSDQAGEGVAVNRILMDPKPQKDM
jgi:hypothetical protein